MTQFRGPRVGGGSLRSRGRGGNDGTKPISEVGERGPGAAGIDGTKPIWCISGWFDRSSCWLRGPGRRELEPGTEALGWNLRNEPNFGAKRLCGANWVDWPRFV